jgi:hypothetical protein
MGKKRKTEHSYEVVVEESREPASYTVGGSDAAAATQQQQQQAEYQPAEQHAGNGYGYDDYGEGEGTQHSAAAVLLLRPVVVKEGDGSSCLTFAISPDVFCAVCVRW